MINFKKFYTYIFLLTCCATNLFGSTSTDQNKRQRLAEAVGEIIALELESSKKINKLCLATVAKLEKEKEALQKENGALQEQLHTLNAELDAVKAVTRAYGMANGNFRRHNNQLEQENSNLKIQLNGQQISSSSRENNTQK